MVGAAADTCLVPYKVRGSIPLPTVSKRLLSFKGLFVFLVCPVESSIERTLLDTL